MSLEAIVTHYRRWYRPQAEAELDCFRQQPTLDAAIALAAMATDGHGRRFSHQRRLEGPNLEKARDRLLRSRARLESQQSFARLHDEIGNIVGPIAGLGPLYRYDTALRIGARLGHLPKAVYLHAGTAKGAAELGILFDAGQGTLFRVDLPAALRILDFHQIEDVLCIYKGALRRAKAGEPVALPEDDRCYLDDVAEE